MASANKQVICEELMRLAAQDRDVLVLCSDSPQLCRKAL